MAEDPYHLVKEDIMGSVEELRRAHERLGAGGERATRGEALRQEAESILWQVNELERATDMAEQDPGRFNLSASEIHARRSWHRETKTLVEAIKGSVEPQGGGAMGGRGGAGAQTRPEGARARLEEAHRSDNDAFVNHGVSEQAQLMREQDAELEDLSGSIARLGQVGLEIGTELEAQATLLEELDEAADNTSSRLHAAQRKIVQVLKKTGIKGQLIIIAILFVLLLVLTFIAFS
mmetsp:Transcript_25672/g.84540  ORF Transcript_25672/g.84540 Transcript_25672/m.84540 type:complete len:235 (+) Transcript_25672:17-721(+)